MIHSYNRKISIMNKVILLIVLIMISCGPKGTPEERIDNLMQEAFDKGDFVGSVLVANNGTIIYQKNFGMADAENKIPVSDSTKFLIASVSKPFTAILILQLVEEGEIYLHDPLSKFFNVPSDSRASTVTIHQLLTHTSGIEELIKEDHAFGEADLEQAGFDFDPGSDFKYSSTGYVILKEIAERVSGKDYETLIDERICRRAQLRSSGVARDLRDIRNLALGYETAEQVSSTDIGYPLRIVDGAGSLYSTATDLFELDRTLYSEDILSKKSIELMQQQHVKERFGYGWFLRERSGIWDVMYHEGDLPGYTSFISRRTKKDEVIILLSNIQDLDLSDIESDLSAILKFDN